MTKVKIYDMKWDAGEHNYPYVKRITETEYVHMTKEKVSIAKAIEFIEKEFDCKLVRFVAEIF